MSKINILINGIQTRRGRALLIFLLIISSFLSAFGQSFRVLSTKDGLPQSFISGLVQDDNGFIWIGTRNGLARYDGIQCRIFQHNLRDTTTLASNVILGLNKDIKNNIWIEHESGAIDKLNPVTEKIEHFITPGSSTTSHVGFVRRGWLVDSYGIFWRIIKSGGLNSYDGDSKVIHQYNRLNQSSRCDTLRGMVETKRRQLWVLGQHGISRYDRHSKRFSYYSIPYKQDFTNNFDLDEEVVDLHERRNTELMWGDRDRLYFFNPANRSFRTILLPVHPFLGVKWLRTGPDGLDYFECDGRLFRYDDHNRLTAIANLALEHKEDARSFLVDRSGLVWIGTNATGIRQIDPITPFFPSFPYKKRFPEDLLSRELKLNMAQVFDWTDDADILSSPGYHFRSVYDDQKLLWMGLKETVCSYDFRQHKLTKLPNIPVKSSINNKTQIWLKGITLNPEGSPMVIGEDANIFEYEPVINSWKNVLPVDALRKKINPSILPQDILADKNRLWITTAMDGLVYVDIRTKEIYQLKERPQMGHLSTNQLLGLKKDPTRDDLLWIGSYQGLICLHKKTMLCEVFSLKEGLPDNTIYSILDDRSGNFWLSTNKGLCRFNLQTHTIRVFRTSYGLPGDEFNRFHHLELPDGRLAFGGTEGWTLFDPLIVKDDNYRPGISLTSLKINNVNIIEGANSRLFPAPLNSMVKLELPYESNTVTIGFAGLEFNQPQDILYRYRLAGYDDDWVMAGHSSIANYTKIRPGHYTFIVNASNTTGQWSNQFKRIEVIIAPPWWQTWWAYLCYVIIAGIFIVTYIRFRTRRILLREQIILKDKEASQLKELDELKNRFFSNITHEFRTPLSLILGPAEQLSNRYPEDSEQQQLSNIIENNALHLLQLINQLMDLAKLEAKALKHQQQEANMATIIGTVIYSFENEALSKKISLTADLAAIDKVYLFSCDAMERIIYNLVSNALKFTPPEGAITVSVTEKGDEIQLIVRDTGIGIAKESLPFIFDRFYQAPASNFPGMKLFTQPGTGLGLALVKELVELEGGNIEVQSRVSKPGEFISGTVFIISLPYLAIEPAVGYLRIDPEIRRGDDDIWEESERQQQILLVEDNHELAKFIKNNLEGSYHVTHVENGASALESALSIMPDLIISDVLMPVMDGFMLCARLKEDIRVNHIPIILLTARASQESRIEGLSLGADDYLTKPFYMEELLLRVRNLLDRQQKTMEHLRQELSLTPLPATGSVTASKDIFLDKLNGFLETHLGDSLFGVDQLAALVDMSRTSLHRKIKAMAGIATSEYVRNYRLSRATDFLRNANSSTATAYLCGFGSPAYFTRCFREIYGITPSEFARGEYRPENIA